MTPSRSMYLASQFSSHSSTARRLYRTERPSLRNRGPPPRHRHVFSVLIDRPVISATAGGLIASSSQPGLLSRISSSEGTETWSDIASSVFDCRWQYQPNMDFFFYEGVQQSRA